MRFLTPLIVLALIVVCFGAPLEKQQAVDNFRKSASNLKNAFSDIVQHSTTEVRLVEVSREADEAKNVYVQQFLPALDDLTPFFVQDESDKSVSYEGAVVVELQKAVKKISLSPDELLALLLGDDVMQTDGARLEVNLRLLSSLLDRFADSSQPQEVSLATVKEVSVVAGAAMEAVMGVRDAADGAAQDAKTVFGNTLNDESSKVNSFEKIDSALNNENDDFDKAGANGVGNVKKIRNRRGWRFGFNGLNYRRGNFHFNARPTWRGFRPSGARATFRWTFGK